MLTQKQVRRQHRGLDRIFYAGQEIFEIPMLRGGAGSYPDAPSRRMALDDDGTVMGRRNQGGTGSLLEATGAQKADMQREDGTATYWQIAGGSAGSWYLFMIFPELREFDGIYCGFVTSILTEVHSSGDTTNTFDGTWTQRIADIDNPANTLISYRTDITSVAVSNVRGIRVRTNDTGSEQRFEQAHIYGEISAGETPDRLLWFDQATALEFAKPQDYGDVPRGSAEDKVTYLKNNSAALTANTVQVTAEDLFGGSGGWFTFDEGTGFSSTLSLASSIANGANSPNITVRRITPDAGALGLHAARAYVNVGSWT